MCFNLTLNALLVHNIKMMGFLKKYLWVFALIIALIAADIIIKLVVFGILEDGQSITVIKNLFSIEKVYNTGASFGILPGKTLLFVIFTVVLLFILMFIYYKTDWNKYRFFSVAYALIYAGAIGNFIDRIFLKYVRDYLYIHFFPAVFNFADICITLGTILLIIFVLFIHKTNKTKKGHKHKDAA